MGFTVGCFNGTGAEGLPCRNDADCGLDLTCDPITECCGGDCRRTASSTSEGSTETTTTTTTATTETTTTETTTTVSPTTEGSTGEPICGDGVMNGDSEECDPGPDGTTSDFVPCTQDCLSVDFLFAPVQGQSEIPAQGAWDASMNEVGPDLETGPWGVLPNGEWGAGTQPPPLMGMDAAHGVKTLVSETFRIDAPRAELILDHALRFNECGTETFYDGGRVYGVDMDGVRVQIAPEPDGMANETWISPLTPNAEGCAVLDAEAPWVADQNNAFVGEAVRMNDSFPIPSVLLEKDIRLEFAAAFDCSYCGPPDAPPRDPWIIRAAVVKPLPQ